MPDARAAAVSPSCSNKMTWAMQRGRYMTLETIAALCDKPAIKLPAVAAR
jgi:hypothetical protein